MKSLVFIDRIWPSYLFGALVLVLGLGNGATATADVKKGILVLSAASSSGVVQDIARNFTAQSGIDVHLSVASSGTLARQISRGAPADIYVSASEQWANVLAAENRLSPIYVRPLMRNRLVVVSPTGSSLNTLLDLSKPVAVLAALGDRRFAMGDPLHVPAGRYAQTAFERLGLWAAVRDRLALQVNVRAVLAMVERGETPLGVIYATDAALSSKVKIAAIVPAEAHPTIQYVAAILSDRDRPDTRAFFEALFSPSARAIIAQSGFALSDGD